MLPAEAHHAAEYQLPLQEDEGSVVRVRRAAGGGGISLPEPLLVKNVLWFCRLRWIIIGILMAFGIVGIFEDVIRRIGLHPPGNWPLLAGGVLTLSNAAFLIHASLLSRRGSASGTMINIWAQILTDLLVLTAVVHFLGSVRTYVPFTYLFHIVLACIFFSRRQSLLVTIIAGVLYAACIGAEYLRIIPPVNVFVGSSFLHPGATRPEALLLSFFSATGV